jgi:hypothetical protein
VTDYHALLRELAIPRLVGSANHERVRAVLKRELAARGFGVEEHVFSGRPSRALLGTPPLVRGINIIAPAVRPSARPPVWLVAHYDSKGQPIAMAVRLVGVVSLVAAIIAFFFASLPAVVFLLVAVAILSQNRVTDNSPGAVDNATALVTAFMTVDLLKSGEGVGVIFPDAEEFGLLGARSLARERAALFADAAVINLDGLDDIGPPIAFLHRPGKVGAAVAGSLDAIRSRWLPVVVDGIVLATVAAECVTIMKGNWRTMRVVHTPKDSAERLTLGGARTVAEGLARALRTA